MEISQKLVPFKILLVLLPSLVSSQEQASQVKNCTGGDGNEKVLIQSSSAPPLLLSLLSQLQSVVSNNLVLIWLSLRMFREKTLKGSWL